jgi:hypothetical protein
MQRRQFPALAGSTVDSGDGRSAVGATLRRTNTADEAARLPGEALAPRMGCGMAPAWLQCVPADISITSSH